MLAFLLIALVGAALLFGVISQDPRSKRGRSRTTRHGRHTKYAAHRQAVDTLTPDQIATRWSTIEAMAAGGGNGLRQAINEADKLLDHVLRQQGASGEHMGERLKSAKPRFASDYSVYDGIWRAHKLRNALAHEVGFDLVASQAKEALSDFQAGLKTLGAL